jgi:hypothetical protein
MRRPHRNTAKRRKCGFCFHQDAPLLIAPFRADIERIVEFLREHKPAISWAEAGWNFWVRRNL